MGRAQAGQKGAGGTGDTYETHVSGIRILPGQWRPHYPWEHIVWISPPWPSQDYLWLDFPEAIFTDKGLIFLSHINPKIPSVYPELPRVSWQEIPNGLEFKRILPNEVSFGGRVTRSGDNAVDLALRIRIGSGEKLGSITLQTCAFLRAIKEFGDFTTDNKFLHTRESGWVSFPQAAAIERPTGRYGLGWRSREKPVADLPAIVTVSNAAPRLVAMTWFEDTLSMVSNPRHPCMHADPQFPDLSPGEEAFIKGKLIFFEGKLEEFTPDLGP